MSRGTEAEPKWLRYFDKLMEFSFMFSVVLMVMLSLLIVDIFMFSDEDDYGVDNSDYGTWCEEYHPELTYNECADVAGW
mgnify:CR=1 FL=1